MFTNNELQKHLIEDGFFENNSELIMIDDYNCLNISDEAIDFFVNSFENTGVEIIKIYYQVKLPGRPKDLENYKRVIEAYANKCHINKNLFEGFLHLINKDNKTNISNLFNKIANNWDKINNYINQYKKFYERMENIGISVKFYPYKSLSLKPPFHGRYWLTPKGAGYIVDGSLSTYGKGRIFAQRMDEENYSIVYGLYQDEILDNTIMQNGVNKEQFIDTANRVSFL